MMQRWNSVTVGSVPRLDHDVNLTDLVHHAERNLNGLWQWLRSYESVAGHPYTSAPDGFLATA